MAEAAVDVLEQVQQWQKAGKGVALATAGSHLAVNADQAFVGSVSGGCIEGAVVTEALQVIKDGKPRQLEFGVSDEMAWSIGLACGGKVKIYVERVE